LTERRTYIQIERERERERDQRDKRERGKETSIEEKFMRI